MKTAELRILLTGAGAPGVRGTIYALRQNPDGRKVRIVGIDIKQDVVGRFLVECFHRVPAPEHADYLPYLLDLCRREEIELVLPQTTRETAVLSHHKERFAAQGVHVMAADGTAIDIANDKGRLLDTFRHTGLPYPQYYRARNEAEVVEYARKLGYPEKPVVVKPPVSNGMRGLRILRENAWDAERYLKEKPDGVEIALCDLLPILRRGRVWPELLVTEFLPGPEYSVDAFLGTHVRVAIPRLRRAIRSGISFENEIEYREDLSEYTLRAAAEIGLTGTFGFQFKLDTASVPKVLECNPRVQGTMVATAFSGVNVIWLAVLETLGEPPATIPATRQHAQFFRYWGGIGVHGNDSFEI